MLQFIELPVARWAHSTDAELKTLKRIPNRYGLHVDHRRDVEGFLVAQQTRMPTAIQKTAAVVSAASETAKRLRALYRMRELWSSRIERRLTEKGIGGEMDISNIVFNMFLHTVINALSPWFAAATAAKTAGKPMIDFINGAISNWYTWGQKVQLSAVSDVLLRHAEAEKDMLLREYESRDEDDKRILGIQKKLHIGRYEAGDVKRMDVAVYERDAGLAARLAKYVEDSGAR